MNVNTYRHWKDGEGNWHKEYISPQRLEEIEFDSKVRASLKRIKEEDEAKEQQV